MFLSLSKSFKGLSFLILSAAAFNASASIISSSDTVINGTTYGTFYDNVADTTWLTVDSFYGNSHSQVNTSILGSGWTFSDTSKAFNMLDSNISSMGFSSVWNIMFDYDNGSGRDNLIWGMTDTAAVYAYDYSSVYSGYYDSYSDLGAFVYLDGSLASVPEPSIIALMGLGLFGLGLSRRKMKR